MSGFTCAAINRLDFSQLTSSSFAGDVATRVEALLIQSSGTLLKEAAPLESAIQSHDEPEILMILEYLQQWVCRAIDVPLAGSS